MFTLTIHDRNGNQLNEGDIVKISDGKNFNFYCQVTYLQDEEVLAPFHTFTFHSVVKVDSISATANKSSETRYNIWYETNAEKDDAESFEKYLRSWRECESQLEKRAFRIQKIQGQQKLF